MKIRIAVLALILTIVQVTPVQADKLVLKDGRTFSGQVTSEKTEDGRRYTIVTEDGKTLTFTKDEVKRSIHECSLSDWELLQQFEEWRELVNSVLELKEPSQREFLFQWHDHARNIRGDLWETPPHSDKFVDEWARYAAEFKSVAESMKYKKLLAKRKGSASLQEYAMFPPEGREEIAGLLKEALRSFEKCLTSAKATDGLVRGLPEEQVRQAKKVRNRQSVAVKANARQGRSTHTDAQRRHTENRQSAERAARKDAEVRQQILKMANQIERKTQDADTRINRFAQERIVTLEHVRTAGKEIERVASNEGGPRAPSPTNSVSVLLPDGTVTREFRQIISTHRKNAAGLTTLGVDALREKTLAAIQELFVGKRFTLELEVKDVRETDSGGYILIAGHHGDWGDKVVETVEAHFDGGIKYEIIRCKRGATVEAEVRIKRVALHPNLRGAEASDDAVAVHFAGDIVGIKRGCKWE